MRDGSFSFIIPKLHKSENISIFVLCALASMLFVPVSAYEENVSFDGDSSFNLLNCSRIVWHIDSSTGHLSLPSLRSGPIQSGGISCVAKEVEGPARISFSWKVDQDTSQVGMLVFMVDNETILQCTSTDWSPVDYAVPSGSHRLSWEYRKLRSYPEYTGSGWIDDLLIVYLKERMPGVLPEKATCCDQLPSIRENLGSINGNLSRLETRVNQMDLDIGALSYNQTTLYELVGRLNRSELDERLRQLDIKIGGVDKKMENLSFNQTAPSNLSWIWENVVYISNNNENLEEVINKNRNKIILLGDGVYHTGGLNITTSDVHIRSLRKWGAVLDGDNKGIGVTFDTVKNVTLDSVAITNSFRGVHIENCTNCNIINNLITDFNEAGILSRNNSQCTFMLNRLDTPYVPGVHKRGFEISRNDNNNTYLFNKVNISKTDRESFLYSVDIQAKDNYITVTDDGFILEGAICCNSSDNEFSCNASLENRSTNRWDFLTSYGVNKSYDVNTSYGVNR